MSSEHGSASVEGRLVTVDGRDWYRIDGLEHLEPFLVSVVSDADLWMFVSSTGALTAGRVDADHALLPYETDDRIHRAAGVTGPITWLARQRDGHRELWRPFAADLDPAATRSLAKPVRSNALLLEERHEDWALAFRVTWAPSPTHGWVRTVEVEDLGGDGAEIEVLDGLLDVMPTGVDARTEQLTSNLVDAYKRSEIGPWGRVALYTLESLITDRAEPAEALAATAVWSAGLPGAQVHLDERVIASMRAGTGREPTSLLTGRRGCYLLRGTTAIPPGGVVSWDPSGTSASAPPTPSTSPRALPIPTSAHASARTSRPGTPGWSTCWPAPTRPRPPATRSPTPTTCRTCCSTPCGAASSPTATPSRSPTSSPSSATATPTSTRVTPRRWSSRATGSSSTRCTSSPRPPATRTWSASSSSTCP